MKIGYIRVSTKDQNTGRQIEALHGLCDRVEIETTGATEKRPVWTRVIEDLRAGDTLVILDLDRAFRSTIDALMSLEALRKREIDFEIVNQNIDTSTDVGRVIFGVLALLAEFELKTLRRRTREGLEVARASGQRLGRPPALTGEQIALARDRVASKAETVTSMARILGVHRATLSRELNKNLQKSKK